MPGALTRSRCLDRLRDDLLATRIIENSLRGHLCEIMVAEAMGPECRLVSGGWHAWDLELGEPGTPDFLRIQVKNSAALQSWHSEGSTPSECSFSLTYRARPAFFERDNPGVPCEPHGFLCDLYVLCHHPETDPSIADHADPDQWLVYLVPTDPKRGAITADEIERAEQRAPRPRAVMRKPGTLETGIRGRIPIRPIPLAELSPARARAAAYGEPEPSKRNMTPEEFSALRAEVGYCWGPRLPRRPFSHDKARADWQRRMISDLVNINERTIRRWEKPSGSGPHPTAALLLSWARVGWWPETCDYPDWSGDDFRRVRDDLGWSEEEMAAFLNIEPRLVTIWEEERGPHGSAIAALASLRADDDVSRRTVPQR